MFHIQLTVSKEHAISEDELLRTADRLRPYTEQAIKIEVAPWIRDYVVDMVELYTDLTLEKVKNKPIGIVTQTIQDFRELFDDQMFDEVNFVQGNIKFRSGDSDTCEMQDEIFHDCLTTFESIDNSKHKDKRDITQPDIPQKILIKGDPGMGKTTFCKKIAWDWAKKLFTTFSIVFFVFLKLVKPGDAVENVIVQQNPFIRGLSITEKRLKGILDTFGNKCLIILDGLDEHALGTNKDVLKIIRGERCLNCNIIVTSRPHSTSIIQQYFPTIVRVDGFTIEKAEQFVSKILRD